MSRPWLRNAMDAIWAVHGEEMAFALGQRSPKRWKEALPAVDDVIDEDDIPY